MGQKMASETTDTVRQNVNLYLKNEEYVSYYSSICSFKNMYHYSSICSFKNMYHIIRLFAHCSFKNMYHIIRLFAHLRICIILFVCLLI